MKEKDILLVKLPNVEGIDQEFFGMGYYTDHGFVFTILTEDLIKKFPLRRLPFPEYTGYDSSNQIEILGQIKSLIK